MTDLTAGAEAGHDAAPAEGATSLLDQMAAIAETEEQGGQQGEGEQAQADAEPKPEPKGREPLPPEEIEKRWRQTQGALRSTRGELQALRRQLTELQSKGAPASQQEDTPPDPVEDPIGALEWQQRQFLAQQAAQREQSEQQARSQETQTLVEDINRDEAAFAATAPDYADAISFLKDSRRNELIELGASEDDVDQIVAQEFVAGVLEARKQGLSPARVAYKLAKDRGYAKAEPKPAADKLEGIAAGMAASRTLTANGGKSEAAGGSIEAKIGNLTGQALRDAWRKHKGTLNG